MKNQEVLSFADMVELEFLNLYNDLKVMDAPEKRKADVIDSIWPDIYEKVFKPSVEDTAHNNQKSKLKTYDIANVEEVTNMFIKLNKRYGGVIKFNQFANLTGITYSTLNLWEKANTTNGYIFTLNDDSINEEYNNIYIISNGKEILNYINNQHTKDRLSKTRFDVIKKLRAEMKDSNTNALSNDTMGHAIRANNEEELGKLYEPKRMVQAAQIKNTISVQELQQLANIKKLGNTDK